MYININFDNLKIKEMTLKEQIQKDRMVAMKESNIEKKNVLSAVIGELDRTTKDPTDAQVISVIKKLVEANVECKNEKENQYIQIYLPQTLSDSQLSSIIANEINANGYSSMKDMGKIMSYLSSNYAGQYDGKIASETIKKQFV
jgi:uncharacterized protein YqeY